MRFLGTSDHGITKWEVPRKIVRKPCPPVPPQALDTITDAVLAYSPKPKSKAAKKRKRKEKKLAQ